MINDTLRKSYLDKLQQYIPIPQTRPIRAGEVIKDYRNYKRRKIDNNNLSSKGKQDPQGIEYIKQIPFQPLKSFVEWFPSDNRIINLSREIELFAYYVSV